jgi:hypothetical protein
MIIMPKKKSNAFKRQYILDNTGDLDISERKTILRMIYNSKSSKYLNEKGSGTQIDLSKLTSKLITSIYDYIVSCNEVEES